MAVTGRNGLESAWCRSLDSVSWLGPLSPCAFETVSSVLLLTITLVSLLAQGGRLGLIHQLKFQGRLRKGVSGLNGSFIAASLFLVGTHLLHFSVGVALLRAWPFHIVYHASLAVVWAVIAGFALYTGRLLASVDFRAATLPAALVYTVSLYYLYRLYFDPHGIPLPYIKAAIWTAMLQAVVAAAATWLGWRRAAATPPAAALAAAAGLAGLAGYEPLPDGEAGSNGGGGSAAAAAAKPPHGAAGAAAAAGGGGGGGDAEGGEADERTWISLFSEAVAYVWPEELGLQLRALGCLLLLVAMRFINLAVPILYKRLVDTLAAGGGGGGKAPTAAAAAAHEVPGGPLAGLLRGVRLLGEAAGGGRGFALAGLSLGGGGSGGGGGGDAAAASFGSLVWPWIALYLAAVFFQGGAGGGLVGFINNVRYYLWIPVSQDAYKRISLRVFDHVMDLDLSFHLRKKTGEVTKVVDRGTNAIQNILSTVLFNILPQVFDVLAAATYLAQALEPTIAIIVFVTVGSYIPLTVAITEWRGKLRREMNSTEQVKSARATDALLNYETVKYFTNEKHESSQYAASIAAYQSAEYRSQASINLLNVVQSAVMFAGIASGLLVCAGGVANRTLTVGDAVLFLSLMAQLYGPLNFFGTYYRTIQQYMIDMENLLELLTRRAGVEDSPTARDLVVAKGELSFDDVSFAYEAGNAVLRGVSFRVPGGQTIALVGATGSGKSTVTRLIFRFYDVTAGAVRVDGQDVRDVTQTSLRRAIGMVPQDTVLFNDTILHNIRYGNLEATDEQVYEAARLACIHDTIVNRFPKGYGTVVGERGLKLSGGEKQRVAFARALLKNAPLLVLDEATSALDTITEKNIQAALSALRASRTTIIVAHRLSTIMDADIILVLAAGQVAESGSHWELIEKGGLYAEMWARQDKEREKEGSASAGPGSLRGSAADLRRLVSPAATPAAAAASATPTPPDASVSGGGDGATNGGPPPAAAAAAALESEAAAATDPATTPAAATAVVIVGEVEAEASSRGGALGSSATLPDPSAPEVLMGGTRQTSAEPTAAPSAIGPPAGAAATGIAVTEAEAAAVAQEGGAGQQAGGALGPSAEAAGSGAGGSAGASASGGGAGRKGKGRKGKK